MADDKLIKKLADITTAPEPTAEYKAMAEKENATLTGWSPDEVMEFAKGQLTLGEVEGISKADQYGMAQIGHTLLTEGKLEQAGTIFEGLHSLDPFDAYFLTALGSIAQQQGKNEEAENHYTRVLEINPFSIPARAHRGEVRVMLGKLGEAVEDFTGVAQEDPKGIDPAAKRAHSIVQVLMTKIEEQNQGSE